MSQESERPNIGGNNFLNSDSIQNTMTKAFENATTEEEVKEVTPEPSSEPAREEESAETSTPEADTSEEGQEDVSEPEDDEAKQDDAPKEEQPEKSEQPSDKIPVALSEDVKKIWSELPDSVKVDLQKREKDFAKKIQTTSEFANHSKAIRDIEAPYQAMMQSLGANSLQAYQDHLKTAYTLNHGSQQQKLDLIQKTIQAYGIELPSQQVSDDDWDFGDNTSNPEIEDLKKQVGQLTNMLNGQQQNNQNIQQAEADKVINDFKADPEHKYFDEVNPLMQGILQSGEAKTLEDAYDMAVMAHPKVRTSVLAEKNSKAEKERKTEAKKKANKAKKTAGTNLTSKGGHSSQGNDAKPVKRGQMPDFSQTMKNVYASMQEE